MPVFKNHASFKVARNVRVFLKIDVGLTRIEVLDDGERGAAREHSARQPGNQGRKQARRLQQLRKKLSERDRRIAALQASLRRHDAGTRTGSDKDRAGPSTRSRSRAASGDEQESRKLGPEEENGIKKVQVGCGPHNLMTHWWNVDIRSFPGIDAVMDATKPWPYEDLEYVFGEHFLEHLTLDGAIEFLKHAGNSLKPGGILRLSTPNLKYVLHTHFPSGEAEPSQVVSGTLKLNKGFHGWGHQFLYSKEMLAYVLEESGFEEISFFSYGESNTPELRNLERHGKFRVH